MPKRVDHEERRRQIADALLRTAAARGLHATGMREVAAEAGVSLRLVQYYFGTKEELLVAGMQHLATRFADQAMRRIRQVKETGREAGSRDVIAAILAEALPADDERRTFAVLNAAYFALALTDPALATAPLVKNTNAVIDVIAAQLRTSQAAGGTPAHLDPDAEALSLLAMASGLANSVLAGHSPAERAQAVIDYQLNRLFPVPRPALRRTPVKPPATDPGVPVRPRKTWMICMSAQAAAGAAESGPRVESSCGSRGNSGRDRPDQRSGHPLASKTATGSR